MQFNLSLTVLHSLEPLENLVTSQEEIPTQNEEADFAELQLNQAEGSLTEQQTLLQLRAVTITCYGI